MRLTGRIVFAIRAAAELAGRDEYVPLDQIAQAQDLPADYVRSALSDLRRSGIVRPVAAGWVDIDLPGPLSRSPWPTSFGQWMVR